MASWSPIGPQPTSSPFYTPFVSGRVSALVVDPTNANVVYAGAAEGGIWKTTDGGTNWVPLTDGQASLATGSIALDPQNHNTVYVGTGEENFSGDSYYGAGVLKSTNGGASWTQLPGPFVGPTNSNPPTGGAKIGGIAVQPGNSNVLLASFDLFESTPNFGFGGNIARSTDGGTSWTNVLTTGSQFALGAHATAVLFDSTNGNIAYAALGNGPGAGVYRSSDGGKTWAILSGTGAKLFPTSNVGRISLAIAPSAPATLFASVADSSSGHLLGMFKTTDSGQNWDKLVNLPDYCGSFGQCAYDNTVVIDPVNAQVIFAGGEEFTNLFQSLDGGNTWTIVVDGANGASLHPDLHALAFDSSGAKLYVGNDGGVWSSTNPTAPVSAGKTTINWNNLNATLGITQFYPNMGLHPTNPNIMFGGNQDNGTQQYTGSLTWIDTNACGDGSSAAIDFANPNNVYANCNGIDVEKSTTAGAQFSFAPASSGIVTTDRRLFIPPMIMDRNNSSILYFGTFRLYQTTNGAGTWAPISPDLTKGSGFFANITAIAPAPSSSNTVYVGTGDGKLQITSNALAGAGATWTDRSVGLPGNSLTQIAVDPANAATVYVTLSGFNTGHVFRSINSGASWADISGNLPNIPANAVVVDPNIPNTLYIGTDVGVFTTGNANATPPTWSTMQTGLPNVAVLALGLQNSNRLLIAGTHGRSAWQFALPGGFTLGALAPAATNVLATGTSNPAVTFQVSANGALGGPVTLTCPSGLPSGANCNFSPSASLNPAVGTPVTVTLTVTTSGSPTGNTNVTVAADSPGQPQQTQPFALHVLPDYSFNISDPVQSTTPGQNVTFHGLLTTGNGYNSNVTITCGAGKPSTCTPPGLLVPSLAGTPANVAVGSASTGDFSFNINASGSDVMNVSRSQPVTLHVVQVNFSTNPPAAINVAQGSTSAPIPLQVSATGLFQGDVTLSCPGLPVGATCNFSPASTVQPRAGSPAAVTMIVNAGTAAAGSTGNLAISGAVANPTFTITSSTYTLNITNVGTPADLAVALSIPGTQPLVVPVGSQATFTATVTNNTAASGSVSATLVFNLSMANLLVAPAGCSLVSVSVTCSFSVTNGTPVSKTFTVTVPFIRNLTGTASVSASVPDPTPGNDTAAKQIQIRPRPLSRKGLPAKVP